MKIQIKVIPRASKEEVLELAPGQYRVKVMCPPVDGKANAAVVELLARYFKVKKAAVTILRGENSKNKMIEILL